MGRVTTYKGARDHAQGARDHVCAACTGRVTARVPCAGVRDHVVGPRGGAARVHRQQARFRVCVCVRTRARVRVRTSV